MKTGYKEKYEVVYSLAYNKMTATIVQNDRIVLELKSTWTFLKNFLKLERDDNTV